MATTPTFNIRGIGEMSEDGQFILSAFDASLPQLASIGSGGQWGSQPFSERPNIQGRLNYEKAKQYQTTGEGEPIRIFIIETEIPPEAVAELPDSVRIRTGDGGEKFLAVGSMTVSEGKYPEYLIPHSDKEVIKKELDGTSEYVYLEALITDFRTGPWRKGAGAALIERARQYCREKGKKIMYVDSYAGNDRKLVKYYENQGFTVISDFLSTKPDGYTWPGTFFRMDVPA